MQLRRSIINRNTPISVEREFALFDVNHRPLARRETHETIRMLKSRLETLNRHGVKTDVVEEVAQNSVEVKICFSNVARLVKDIVSVYRVIGDALRGSNTFIIGISQPDSAGLVTDFTHFMTVDVFKDKARFFAPTNSLHLHIGVVSEEDAIALYNAANRAAPFVLALSQCSVIDGHERGRAHFVSNLFADWPEQLVVPWAMASFSDFEGNLEGARKCFEDVIKMMSPSYIARLAARYPDLIRADGVVLRIGPDKVFHPARLRPDKRDVERGLVGSVEFRQLDGQPSLDRDLAMIELTLGLIEYMAAYRAGTLSEKDRDFIAASIHDIPKRGLDAVLQDGFSTVGGIMEAALLGLEMIGELPTFISLAPLDGGQSEFSLLRGKPTSQIISESHRRFINSTLPVQ